MDHLILRTTLGLTLAMATTHTALGQTPSLTLADALALGFRRAPVLANVAALRHAASSQIAVQRAGYLPRLSATVTTQATHVHNSPAEFATPDNASVHLSGRVEWNVYDFGRTSHRVDAAIFDEQASRAEEMGARLQVQGAIAQAYIRAYRLGQLEHTLQRTVEQRQQLHDVATGMVASGLQPPVEQLRAKARWTDARRQLVTAAADTQQAKAELRGLLGLVHHKALHLAAPTLTSPLQQARPLQVAQLPAVRAARSRAQSAEAQLQAAWTEYLPQFRLELDASYEPSTTLGSNPIRFSNRALGGRLTMTAPLFEWGTLHQARQAAAQKRAQEQRLRETQRDVEIEQAQALIALEGAEQGVALARQAASQAADVLTVVKARYIKGLSSPIELIAAESTEAEARLQEVQAELARDLAAIRALSARGIILEAANR